mmetsp:Transcript_42823/g.121022  ORF Transcript_42823/g.121022 Transcript_42823/m.121022 type:complete len:205 (+) Transcript_42823:208-822(+)
MGEGRGHVLLRPRLPGDVRSLPHGLEVGAPEVLRPSGTGGFGRSVDLPLLPKQPHRAVLLPRRPRWRLHRVCDRWVFPRPKPDVVWGAQVDRLLRVLHVHMDLVEGVLHRPGHRDREERRGLDRDLAMGRADFHQRPLHHVRHPQARALEALRDVRRLCGEVRPSLHLDQQLRRRREPQVVPPFLVVALGHLLLRRRDGPHHRL